MHRRPTDSSFSSSFHSNPTHLLDLYPPNICCRRNATDHHRLLIDYGREQPCADTFNHLRGCIPHQEPDLKDPGLQQGHRIYHGVHL